MNEFKLNDPVITYWLCTENLFIVSNKNEGDTCVTGIISQVEKHPTLSTMYRVVDNDGQSLGRFYHHQLELNIWLIRDYKIKQILK